jgi:amino acid transporter
VVAGLSFSSPAASVRKMRLFPLVAATFFMVSGGPYGLEDVVGQAGYGWTLAILILLPLVWSLPTALMVGELAGAMPDDGGFYVWVTRALGGFWGFQEAWLSLAASVFDMALYPTLFVTYLGRLAPHLVSGHRALWWGAALVALCVAWNLLGAYDVGESSRWICCALLLPFAFVTVAGLVRGLGAHGIHAVPVDWGRVPGGTLGAALLVAMWNTMGWDNAATIAREVENPQRNYIRAMLGAVALVSGCYILPVAASALGGVSAAQFATGAWVLVGSMLGGTGLALAITAGGALTSIAMFNALTMSYARLPFAMAQDGWLPAIFARTNNRRVPWVCLLALGCVWLLALDLGFKRLLLMDVVLYGASLVLEFIALAVLRARAPLMARPFRVPGGPVAACLIGVPSAALLAWAAWASRSEIIGGYFALAWCAGIAALGVGAYFAGKLVRPGG